MLLPFLFVLRFFYCRSDKKKMCRLDKRNPKVCMGTSRGDVCSKSKAIKKEFAKTNSFQISIFLYQTLCLNCAQKNKSSLCLFCAFFIVATYFCFVHALHSFSQNNAFHFYTQRKNNQTLPDKVPLLLLFLRATQSVRWAGRD